VGSAATVDVAFFVVCQDVCAAVALLVAALSDTLYTDLVDVAYLLLSSVARG
jgi:hypothetical protein